MTPKEWKIIEKYLGTSTKASRFEACYDYLKNGGSVRDCARRWGWSVSSVGRLIAEITFLLADGKNEKAEQKKETEEIIPITEETLPTLSPKQIQGIDGQRFLACFNTHLYEDGKKITIEEHSRYIGLNMWLKSTCPFCSSSIGQMTLEEFHKLIVVYKFTSNEIRDTILQIENRKDLRKRYSSLYLTLLNWMKRDYGDRRD